MMKNSPLVRLENVSKFFRCGNKRLQALHDISLAIPKGITLGVVGESGSGKSTLGKLILKLDEVSSGRIFFDDLLLNSLSYKQMQPLRRHMQMVFQDPHSSLNPRLTIEHIIGEGLTIHRLAEGADRKEIVMRLVEDVGLDPLILSRYPHEFSGGQKQRIAIARALAVNPRLLVCDEPLSALDTCTHQQVMALFMRLKQERALTYLFISHDLHAVKKIADQVAVMYLGHLVELAPSRQLFAEPSHPYTKALLDAIPIADPIQERSRQRLLIVGEPPSPLSPPKGCPFHPRCPQAMPICQRELPTLQECRSGHFVACHASRASVNVTASVSNGGPKN